MIYDPARRALELRQRILEMMSAQEIEEYSRQTTQPPETTPPAGNSGNPAGEGD